MTRITKLLLHGFKSFAKKTEMVFGENFNCILGPNGSGKSNVLDALCFVLGKSGAKGLRAEKSSNLIYNGGKSKSPAKTGEVSIWLDNSEKTFPLDTNEIKITRIVKPSGVSVYKINDTNSTRQQIIDLLAIARLNPDGYNIILQGDIVRFIEMSPNDRRQIIEEIGGISIYEEKRIKAMRQLDKVDERMKESEIILSERATYIKELKKERDQAAKFKDLDERIKSNKATVLSIGINKKQNEAGVRDKEILISQKDIDKIQLDIDTHKEKITVKKQEQHKINKEVEEKGDKEQVAIQKDIETIKIEHAEKKTRSQGLINEIDRIQERIKQLEFGKKEHSEKLIRLEKQQKEIESRMNSISKDQEMIDNKIKVFKEKHNMSGAAGKEKEIDELDSKADTSSEEIQKLRVEEQNLLREKDRLEYQQKSIDERMEKILAVKKESRQELDKLKQMKLEFKKATVELNTKLNEDSSFSAQLANARNNLLRSQEEVSRLNARRDAIAEKAGGSDAVKGILSLRGRIKGIHGTISELGKVSSEYSVALESAAGGRLKSIIVDDDSVASQCIKFLKDKQLGRATFLPLNKIRPINISENTKSAMKAQGAYGLAQDIVSYDAKFKNAFSYVFGGAVVVSGIDTARRIGIGTAKMVTIEGDVAEISGAMQGGYKKKSNGTGAFMERDLEDSIKKKDAEIADFAGMVSTLEKRKSDNEDSIERLRNTKASLEGEIIKLEKSLHLEEGDTEADSKTKKLLENQIEEAEKSIMDLQNNIGRLNQVLMESKIKKQALRSEVNELKNPRLLAELNTFEQKKQELKDENIRIDAELKGMFQQMNTIISPEVDNINKIIKQHIKEKEEFNNEQNELKSRIVIMEKEIIEKEAKQKKFYSQFKELFTKREKLNEEIQKIETTVIRKEEEIRRHEHKMNSLSLENAKVKAELSSLLEDFKQYEGATIFKDKPIDEIKREISQFEKMVNDIGAVNMKALELYAIAEDEYQKLITKRNKLAEEREDVLLMMNEVEAKKKELFLNTYDVINKNFSEIFKTLSAKGDAFLGLEDEKNVFEGGVTVHVKLNSKKFMDIRSLSGGEKTMTALALIFAIQEHEPAPFYILDEVDAALDKRNSEKLAELVSEYAKKAQYLMISHNDGVISEADLLYGVSMDKDGITKVVTLKI